jgi:excisionase family DNA binding protein
MPESIVQSLAKMPGMIDAKELAKILGLSKQQVHRLARRGDMPSFRIQSSVRFDPRLIAAWLEGSSLQK